MNAQDLVDRFAGRGAAANADIPPAEAGVDDVPGQMDGSERAAPVAPAGRFLAHVDESSF